MRKSPSYMSWLLLVGVVAAMSSCSTYSFTSRTQSVTGGRIAETKKIADVEADFTRKITAVGEWSLSSNAAKQSAEYKAIIDNKIDVLVDPIYKVTVAPVFNTTDGAPWYTMSYRAEVSGFAGTYKAILSEKDQIEQLKNVEREEIEKYKLLNDPDFYKYYYQPKKPDMNGNVIIGGGVPATGVVMPFKTEAKPAGLPVLKDVAPKKEVQTMSEKQIHDLIVTGKAFVGVGTTMLGVGVICASVGASNLEKLNNTYYDLSKRKNSAKVELAGICLVGIGGGFATIIGGACWGVGAKQLKIANGNNLTLNYNVSPTGINMAINF